jgi:hypothetical protein
MTGTVKHYFYINLHFVLFSEVVGVGGTGGGCVGGGPRYQLRQQVGAFFFN